jgi:hypothetical protein
MRWRDIRFEKPTEKDGDVIVKITDGRTWIRGWGNVDDITRWLPVSELPQPDLPGPIPDGWRPVDKAVDAFDARSMLWLGGKWQPTQAKLAWDKDYYYIVPIAPPAPKYRPFANAAEFVEELRHRPYGDRFYRHNSESSDIHQPIGRFHDNALDGEPWGTLLAEYVWCDGSPFGVKVETN